MEILLYLIGAIIIVASFIAGISSGTFLSFIISAMGGFASSVIFFAVAKIIENQKEIIFKLDFYFSEEKKYKAIEKKTCTKCNREYDEDYNSCPHCGNRD